MDGFTECGVGEFVQVLDIPEWVLRRRICRRKYRVSLLFPVGGDLDAVFVVDLLDNSPAKGRAGPVDEVL